LFRKLQSFWFEKSIRRFFGLARLFAEKLCFSDGALEGFCGLPPCSGAAIRKRRQAAGFLGQWLGEA